MCPPRAININAGPMPILVYTDGAAKQQDLWLNVSGVTEKDLQELSVGGVIVAGNHIEFFRAVTPLKEFRRWLPRKRPIAMV